MKVALRRQQAQEENEARELGILFPTPANMSHNEQAPNNCYLSGASSSPNDSAEVKNYSENESGKLKLLTEDIDHKFFTNFLLIQLFAK